MALDELNEKSEPYTGEGTREKPYVFLCKDETIINPSFMNKVKGFTPDGSTKENGGFRGDGSGSYIILEIHVNDDVNSGTQHKIQINGTENNETPFPADQKLIFYADPSTTLEFVEEGTQDSGLIQIAQARAAAGLIRAVKRIRSVKLIQAAERKCKRNRHGKRNGSVKRTGHRKRDGSAKRNRHGKRDGSVKRNRHGKRNGSVKRTGHRKRDGSVKRNKHGKRNGSAKRNQCGQRDRADKREYIRKRDGTGKRKYIRS